MNAIRTETIEYRVGDGLMRGHLALPATPSAARSPGVLVLPDAMGLAEPAQRHARMLAELGYIAFAADLYGVGSRAVDVSQAHALSSALRDDRSALLDRVNAGLATLSAQPRVSGRAVIGYCFGGTCALELAREGADVACVVSFHGALDTRRPAAPGAINAKILVCTGAEDPIVPWSQVEAFGVEMRAAKADWQLVIYGGAKHNFTNPDTASLGRSSVAYDPRADARSWQAMQDLFDEVFVASSQR
jgi:dienelactone hydrolase